MKKLLLLIVLGLSYYCISAQGILRGKITDESGETIVGATVYLKTNTNIGTISDLDGNYSLKIPGTGTQTVVVSYISYKTVEEIITIENGKVLILNFSIEPVSLEMEGVVIIGRAKKANDSYMQTKKLTSSNALDYISKETIKKTGDTHIDDAIKRVTGVSTVGGYVTVRGLADRYIKTTINGSRIPTLDPLSNNIKLDIFPTSLIDNIIINKSASPDLPGDWAGSYLSIETRDYPEKLMINIKTSFGYNSQSSFQDIVSSKKSPTDWLGFDNGYRDVKNFTKETYPYYVENTSPYNEFTELGLEEYFNSLGITKSSFENKDNKETYRRLGLVELGLLAPGFINDADAVNSATDEYLSNPLYKDKAHFNLNSQAIDYSKSLPDNWLPIKRNTLMDFSQDFNIGNQIEFLGRPLGFIAGFRYSSSTNNDPLTVRKQGIFSQANPGEFLTNANYIRHKSEESNQWSGLLNLAYKISPNHSVSLMFMPNLIGVNSARIDSGFNKYALSDYGFVTEFYQRQHYEERKQLIYQYQSSHFFPTPKIRVELNTSYCDGESNAPDFKTLSYGRTDYGVYSFRPSFKPDRAFMYLTDDILDARISAEMPFFERTGLPRKIKIGAAYLSNNRESSQYLYTMQGGFEQALTFPTTQDLENYISIESFSSFNTSHSMIHYYTPQFSTTDFSKGYSNLTSGYAMIDFAIIPSIRISGGIRIEKTDLYTDVPSLFNKNIPANDPLRQAEDIGMGANLFANPGFINETNPLPSINLIYKIVSSDKLTLNSRLSYSKSIARPSIREISGAIDYNYTLDNFVIGNPDLKMVYINNYDIRIESFFSSGDNISASLFYKEFENHIEFGNESSNFTWRNAPGISKAAGIEFEGRKRIFKNLELMSNITLIKSRSVVTEVVNGLIGDTITRSMYGQAPYIANAILSYKSDKLGASATLSYNVQGPKLIFVTLLETQPDVYELPRHFLDLKISKTLGKHFSVELKIKDILKTRVSWAYDYNDYENEFEGYSYGTSYSLGVSYDF